MRRDHNLPENHDTGYKPEDYSAALIEGAEPAVSAQGAQLTAVQPGVRLGSGSGKGRALTSEEIKMAAAAEASVSKLLGDAATMAAITPAPPKPVAKLRKVDENSEEGQLMSKFFGPSSPKKAPPAPVSALPKYDPPKRKTVEVPAPVPVQPTAVSLRNQAAAASAGATAEARKKRKLDSEELTVVGKALQMTVKHRGGGPFGKGRLEGVEANELAGALREVVALLAEDSAKVGTTSRYALQTLSDSTPFTPRPVHSHRQKSQRATLTRKRRRWFLTIPTQTTTFRCCRPCLLERIRLLLLRPRQPPLRYPCPHLHPCPS